MHLTEAERTILCLQYEILEKLDPKNYPLLSSNNFACKERVALGGGYTLEYPFEHLEELSEEKQWLVLDAMQMYWQMETANERLPDEEKFEPQTVKFPGFDGNEETSLLFYAKFLIQTGRFKSFKANDLDSFHVRPADRYVPMIEEYHKILDTRDYSPHETLTRAEIERILNAT